MSMTYNGRWRWPNGAAVESFFERPILDKLGGELRRHQDDDFLAAAMAVCALIAVADDEVKIEERLCIDEAIRTEPAFMHFDIDRANGKLNVYVAALSTDAATARQSLDLHIRKVKLNHKRCRTLMRIAVLIITADHDIHDRELAEFRRLCAMLDLDPDQVWQGAETLSGAAHPH